MYFISFDIDSKKITYALLDDKGIIHHKSEYDTPTNSKESFYMEIVKVVNNYCLQQEISGICVSIKTIVDSKRGIILDSKDLELLTETSLKQELEELLLIDVSIENYAKCSACAEMWLGKGKKYKDVLFLTIDTIVEGALIKNKKIHHGIDFLAGEFGMMLVGDSLDHIKTWESLVSLSNLEKNIKGYIENNNNSLLDCLSLEDEEIVNDLNIYFNNLAIGILNLNTIYNPEIIILGGEISRIPTVLNKLRDAFRRIVEKFDYKGKVPVVELNEVKENSSLIGALYNFLYL